MKLFLNTFKYATLLCAASLLSVQVMAQDEDDDVKPHAGIKGGVNFSNLINEGDEVTDKNAKVGYNIGVFAKLPFSKHFAIQPELLITSKGTRSTYDFGTNFFGTGPGQGTLDFNLTYLEVPVLAVVNLNKYLNVQGGVYGAYLLNAHIKNTSDNPNYDRYRDLNEDNFQRFDYGLAVGVGVDLHPVTAGLRYDYSLRNLGYSGTAGEMTDKSRNSCLQLYVGLGF